MDAIRFFSIAAARLNPGTAISAASAHTSISRRRGGEQPPGWMLMNRRTGRSAEGRYTPVFSPSVGRFATAEDGAANCAEIEESEADIWRLTDSVPVHEWHVLTGRCGVKSGWGISDARWRGEDTVEFRRRELDDSVARGRVIAVGAGAGWSFVP
jgi:hypothetical protein